MSEDAASDRREPDSQDNDLGAFQFGQQLHDPSERTDRRDGKEGETVTNSNDRSGDGSTSRPGPLSLDRPTRFTSDVVDRIRSPDATDRTPDLSKTESWWTDQQETLDPENRIWDEFRPSSCSTDDRSVTRNVSQPSLESELSESETDAAESTRLSTTFDELCSTVDHRTGTRSEPDAENSGDSLADETVFENIRAFSRSLSAAQVLIRSPTNHTVTNDAYSRLLYPDGGDERNVLFVTATGTVGEQLPVVHSTDNRIRGETAIVEVGSSQLDSPSDTSHEADIYKQISCPENLTKLGVVITHILSQWQTTRRPTVLGFHTLTLIHRYIGTDSLFRFLRIITSRLESTDSTGYYHIDPEKHDLQMIESLDSSFDLVVDISPDGDVRIL